jgi:molybdate transport system permease protein
MTTDLSPLWISLKTAGLATVITFFMGTIAAYVMLGYRGRWKSIIEGMLIAPLILPPTVVGFLLLLVFGKTGLVGQFTAQFDFNIVFTWYAAVISATVVAFPLMYKTALGAFEQVDSSLLQVAQTLGASKPEIFWRILLPLSVPGILAGATLAFARALGEFGATLMLAGNIPGETQTMPMAIYFAVEAGDMAEAWQWVFIILGLSLSGVCAVNFWQRGYEQRLSNKGTDRKGTVRDLPIPAARQGEAAVLQITQPDRGAGLWVDIEKHLVTFALQTQFGATQETLGILGSSGSGKSMTLRCIAGIATPNRGKIVLNGKVLFDSAQQINLPSHQRRVSLVFQNYALFPHLTVAENIAFGLYKQPKTLRNQKVRQQLHLLQLEGLEHRYPHQLSGGQQQRVALARALATEPEALLLDEPFSALDTHLRSQVEQQLIKTLSTYSGVTLFVTHNLEEAFRVCKNLMVMSAGQMIALDDKHQIFEHPRTVSVAQLTGCKNFSHAQPITATTLVATDWGVTLEVSETIPEHLFHVDIQVGIRAHQLKLKPNANFELSNHFPCWVAANSETPHRMTVFLKLNLPPNDGQDYHIQVEILKEKWHAIRDFPLPWYVQLDPKRLMLMQE